MKQEEVKGFIASCAKSKLNICETNAESDAYEKGRVAQQLAHIPVAMASPPADMVRASAMARVRAIFEVLEICSERTF